MVILGVCCALGELYTLNPKAELFLHDVNRIKTSNWKKKFNHLGQVSNMK